MHRVACLITSLSVMLIVHTRRWPAWVGSRQLHICKLIDLDVDQLPWWKPTRVQIGRLSLSRILHCVRKKVNPTQCTTEMWNLNASCVNFVCLILKYAVKYAQSFTWKYCLTAELSIFKYWWWNIMVSSAAYCCHSVTFWRNHINNKRGIFRKRSCLNLSIETWERTLC